MTEEDHENTLGVDWSLLQVKQARIYDQMRDVLNAREGLWQADLRKLIDELLEAEEQYSARESQEEDRINEHEMWGPDGRPQMPRGGW